MRFVVAATAVWGLIIITAALPRQYKPWTLAFRDSWNKACQEALTEVMDRRGIKNVPPMIITNLCICSSDLIQQRYSQETIEGFGTNPPQDFLDFSKMTVELCLKPTNGPI
jgi:hypothetical protein